MRLNSRRKKNNTFKWIFFLLVFSLFLYFFKDFLLKYYLLAKNEASLVFLDKENLLRENQKLKKQILNLITEQKINQSQNHDFLKPYLGKEKYNILLNEGNLFEGKILNNHKNKIKKGDKVYFYKNILYGFVTNVNNKFISVRNITDINFKNNFLIFVNGEVIYRGSATGISNGQIKFDLPRDIEVGKKAILILDDGSADVVGEFYKEEFKKQESKRRVYFRLFENPYTVYQVEI